MWSGGDEPRGEITAPVLFQTPLSSVLSDFDSIQKEQKDANGYTEKRAWWLCRFELDQRMKAGRTIKSQYSWVGRDLNAHPPPTPAVGCLPPTPHFPGLQCRGLTALWVQNFLLTSNLNLHSCT